MKQSIFNMISNVLIKIRYKNKKDPFKIFSKIIKNNNLNIDKEKGSGIILITPIRVSPLSNLFEGLIGKFYQLKGRDVRVLLCNQSVNYCENFTKYKNKLIACALCQKEQQRFTKLFKLTAINANTCVSIEEIKQIKQLIKERNFKEREDYIFDGVDLYDSIASGVMRYTLRSELLGSDDLIKKYAFTSFFYSKVISNLNNRYDISTLITSHGIYSTWGSVIATCKKLKIYSIVWGRGYLGQGKLLFGVNQSYHEEFVNESKEEFKNLIIGDKEINEVKNYYRGKMDPNSNVDFINYYKALNLKNDLEMQHLQKKIDTYQSSFGMFTNIPWDGEMLKTTENFPTTRSYVRTVLEWFINNKDCLLIIRAHPAEVTRGGSDGTETFEDLLRSEYPNLPENIVFLPPDSSITSYVVSELVNAIVLFGSTMSLELAIQKKLIIQSGKNNVSFKNIVYDALSQKSLYEYLNKVRKRELSITQDMYQNALQYGYYWINKRHIEDTSVNLQKLIFKSYNFKNQQEFLDDSMLNYVYKKINNKEKIVNE